MTEILTQGFQISPTEQSRQRPTRRATAILHRLTNTRLRYTGLSRIRGSSYDPLIGHTCSGRPLSKEPSEPASSPSMLRETRRRRRSRRQSNPHHQRRLRNRCPSHPTRRCVRRAGNNNCFPIRREVCPVARSKPRYRRVRPIHSARRTRSSNPSNGNRKPLRNLRHALDGAKFRANRHTAARHRTKSAGLRRQTSGWCAGGFSSYCW
jgi:hypothetical protein